MYLFSELYDFSDFLEKVLSEAIEKEKTQKELDAKVNKEMNKEIKVNKEINNKENKVNIKDKINLNKFTPPQPFQTSQTPQKDNISDYTVNKKCKIVPDKPFSISTENLTTLDTIPTATELLNKNNLKISQSDINEKANEFISIFLAKFSSAIQHKTFPLSITYNVRIEKETIEIAVDLANSTICSFLEEKGYKCSCEKKYISVNIYTTIANTINIFF